MTSKCTKTLPNTQNDIKNNKMHSNTQNDINKHKKHVKNKKRHQITLALIKQVNIASHNTQKTITDTQNEMANMKWYEIMRNTMK